MWQRRQRRPVMTKTSNQWPPTQWHPLSAMGVPSTCSLCAVRKASLTFALALFKICHLFNGILLMAKLGKELLEALWSWRNGTKVWRVETEVQGMAREYVRGACAVLSRLGNSLNKYYPSLAKFSSHSPYSEVFCSHCFMLALIGLLAVPFLRLCLL